MARSVLEYVQSTLTVMDSDLVDTISDTTESMQIAELLRDVYLELINREDWAFLYGPIVLTAAADVTQPTKFTIPEDVRFIKELRYDAATSGEYAGRKIYYLEPEDFLARFSNLPDQDTSQLVTLSSQIKFYINNNRAPEFWTSFDDNILHMDSFDSSIQSTLTAAKLSAWGVSTPTVSITDGSTLLPLPVHMEPLLQAELNRQAFQYFKQTESAHDEAKAKRQLAQARRRDSRITREQDEYYNRPGYGRRSSGITNRLLGRQGS